MKTSLRAVAVIGVLLAAACGDNTTGPRLAARQMLPTAAGGVTVMTQNMYVGADLDVVIGALASPDPSDDIPALLFAVQTVEITDYPARAGAIAAEIAKARPDAVGLQEVSTIDVDLTPYGVPAVIHQDFLQILEDSLAARGLHYVTAAAEQNLQAQPIPGISLMDRDAMIVNADRVTVTAATGQRYTDNVGEVAPGIAIYGGFVTVHATVAGQPYVFASSHLASGQAPGFPELRAAQAAEMVASLPAGVPAFVMGDLNDWPGTPMYKVIAGAGFQDTWAALRPGAGGFTCCEQADLANQVNQFDQRIDFVWQRGLARPGNQLLASITRVGDVPADRVAGSVHPVWPSDHAGLVFGNNLPPAP